jgi:membrane fusion protein, multidrug efflux system
MIRSLLLPTVLASSIIFSACGSKNNQERPRATQRSAAMSVSGVIVKARPLTNLVLSSGTVLAAEAVDLAPEASGRIDRISFKEGGRVTQDQLLVKINDDDLQAQLKKTELQIKLASDQEQRQRQLLETNNTSREQYDISLNQLTTLRADRDNLLAAIRKREIRAPFDGIIGLRYVSEGSYVTPSTRIASVQKVDQLKIDFAIPEKYAGQVRVGNEVQFSSEETDQQFTGRIYAIEPKIEPQTRTLQLRAICENRSGAILPGAYVHIKLQLNETNNALVVPTQAVIPILKGQTVLVKRNGIVVSINVRTGIRTSTDVQVTAGLAEGDTVITTGILQLRPGMPVSVTIQ